MCVFVFPAASSWFCFVLFRLGPCSHSFIFPSLCSLDSKKVTVGFASVNKGLFVELLQLHSPLHLGPLHHTSKHDRKHLTTTPAGSYFFIKTDFPHLHLKVDECFHSPSNTENPCYVYVARTILLPMFAFSF